MPEAERDGNLAAAYARLLHDRDPEVRARAARAWCEWEDTHVATVPGYTPNRAIGPGVPALLRRLVTHYWSSGAFLPEGQIVPAMRGSSLPSPAS